MSGRNPAEELISTRKNVFEIFVLTLVIALGVNLVSGSLSLIWSKSLYIQIVFSAVCISFGLAFLTGKILSSLTRVVSIEGVQLLDEKSNKIVEIERYRFSESSRDHMDSIFSENKAIKRLWESGSVAPSIRGEDGKYTRNVSQVHKLQREQLEYFILDSLSTHLTDYFNRNGLKGEAVITFGRRDIPAVLLDNRFLELFSRPMEDREGFRHHEAPSGPGAEVVYAMGSGGERFDRFDLTLPKGSRIQRNGQNILIVTPRFKMEISTEFEGYSTFIEPYFVEKYVGREWMGVGAYKISSLISVKFFPISIITPSGWGYYRWVDSFLSNIEKKISFRLFKEYIGWEIARTTMMMSNSKPSKGR